MSDFWNAFDRFLYKCDAKYPKMTTGFILCLYAVTVDPVMPAEYVYYKIIDKILDKYGPYYVEEQKRKERARSPLIRPPVYHEDRNVCCICLDNPRTHISSPCGHYTYCENCIRSISTCSLCTRPIDSKIKVFN